MKPFMDQRGGTLVYLLVALVVLSLMLVGMLQLSSTSYRTGMFEEERQCALAAAESGIAIALKRLESGKTVPRSEYPSADASIDSTGANWLGPGTGSMPHTMDLGRGASFKVWVSPTAVDDRITIVSEGRSRGRKRIVQVKASPHASNLRFLVSATSDGIGSSITLNGTGSIAGDIHIEGRNSYSVLANGPMKVDGVLYVRPDANIAGIRSNVGSYFGSVEVDPAEYKYPLAVPPEGLPYRGRLIANGWDPVTISGSGEYDSIIVNGACDLIVNAVESDVVVHVKRDFTVNGEVNLKINGNHAFKLYVDRDFTWNGSRGDAAPMDPTQFVVYCRGDWPGHVILNGFPDMAAVMYAPKSDVTFNGSGTFNGAVVAKSVTSNGSGNLVFPVDEYGDKIRNMDLGKVDAQPSMIPGSWHEGVLR